jgi:uncharacterized membrane protein
MAAERDSRASVLDTRALIGVTLAVIALLLVRGRVEPELARGYLVWNLFLAWIPFAGARALWRATEAGYSRLARLPLAALWLAFLPNAPYLVTDVVHMHHQRGLRMALELAVFGSVALAGVLLGVAAIQPIHRLVARRYGRIAARVFPPVIAIAVAFGVYLGRVQRWNSWAVFETPGRLAHATWAVLGHPADHPRAFGGIALFTLAFLGVYLALTTERGSFGTPQRQA